MYTGNNERCYVDEPEYTAENSLINPSNHYRTLRRMSSTSKLRTVA